jgi:hypothetical protein
VSRASRSSPSKRWLTAGPAPHRGGARPLRCRHGSRGRVPGRERGRRGRAPHGPARLTACGSSRSPRGDTGTSRQASKIRLSKRHTFMLISAFGPAAAWPPRPASRRRARGSARPDSRSAERAETRGGQAERVRLEGRQRRVRRSPARQHVHGIQVVGIEHEKGLVTRPVARADQTASAVPSGSACVDEVDRERAWYRARDSTRAPGRARAEHEPDALTPASASECRT